MRLSMSNIGWSCEHDEEIYHILKENGFTGLEIAPTRVFSNDPYDRSREAKDWAKQIKKKYGFEIASMQSIWYGRKEKIFGNEEERRYLQQYTKKAIEFAAAIGCRNLVFGCPRNRVTYAIDDGAVGIHFFKDLGDHALEKGTVIAMEANPPIYGTNYINDTLSAFKLIEQVDSKGFLLNLDIGTMIQNGENVNAIKGKVHLIHHVHISEPELKPIRKRQIHMDLKEILQKEDYQGYISIEMGRTDDLCVLEETIKYVRGSFL